jgi:fumarylacetoacetase
MYGIFSTPQQLPRVGYKVGDDILDLTIVNNLGIFADIISQTTPVFEQPALNEFMALGPDTCRAITQRIREYLQTDEPQTSPIREMLFVPLSEATLHLPVRVGDYTDFYAGIHHAENVGRMFRPSRNGEPADPLLPNYRHMPIAYHGRASSIVVSGTPIRRPMGQGLNADNQPEFRASRSLDFELELGLVIGRSSPLGEPVPVQEAEDYIFGLVIFNDWSARDIQRWEYQPLGPFLGKNFGSSISAWVLPFDDLEPARIAGMEQTPTPLPYLQQTKPGSFDIALEVLLNDTVISQSNARYLYWSFAQMIAHHTSNGCNLNVGDIMASGTISGPDNQSLGSLLELSWNGTRPLTLPDGSQRTFLQDGDRITMRGYVQTKGEPILLGDLSGHIIP